MANSIGPNNQNYPGASIWTPHPKSKAASERAATQQDLSDSNHEVVQAINRNQQTISDYQHQTDANLEHLRETNDEQLETENARQEDALAKQRLKGYEALRDLKRQQDAELLRVRREGENTVKNTQDYYRDTTYATQKQGEETLQQTKVKQARELEFTANTGQTDLSTQKNEQMRKLGDLKKQQEQQYGEISRLNQTEHDRMQTNAQLAIEQDNAKFQGQYKAVFDEHNKVLTELQNNANEEIRQVRQDTAQKLAAYGSRQSDPFYRMVDMGADFRDEGDRYVLTASIPAHEREHVSVSIKGNMLVLSGSRRNEEKLDLGTNRFKGTSSYQSYEESFPLSNPVDRNSLTKEFHGDTVVVTVPKADPQKFHENYQAKAQSARVRAERPHFPGNLPGVSNETAQNSDGTSKKSGRTLT